MIILVLLIALILLISLSASSKSKGKNTKDSLPKDSLPKDSLLKDSIPKDNVDITPNDYSKNIVTGFLYCDVDTLDDAEGKGKFFECSVINTILGNYPDSKILRNLILPKSKAGTSEIDILVLNPKGIVCLECKNYNAKVSGNYNDKYWKAEYSKSYVVDFYSPVLQNLNHVRTLEKLNLGFKVHNLVVFNDNAVLSDEVFKNRNVAKLKYVSNQLDYLFNSSDCNITQEELNNLCNHILQSQTPNVEEHVAYVKSVASNHRDD